METLCTSLHDESQEYVEDMLENKLDFIYQFIDTNNNIINVRTLIMIPIIWSFL